VAGAAACGTIAGCCGSGSTATATPPAVLHGAPVSYVLRLEQLPTAGFTAVMTPRVLEASALSSESAVASAVEKDGLGGVAGAEYVNEVPVLATANGPLDIVATVASFSAASGAHAAMARLAAALDARSGASAVSAGDLGAESHAVSQAATATDGTPVVQITVLWRVANLVNAMAVRGRVGGTGIGDAVIIANRQAAGER
jgi:hypothetical protein